MKSLRFSDGSSLIFVISQLRPVSGPQSSPSLVRDARTRDSEMQEEQRENWTYTFFGPSLPPVPCNPGIGTPQRYPKGGV